MPSKPRLRSMRILAFLFAFTISVPAVCGADLQLADGRVLKDWKVMNASAGFLTIRHSGGAVKVPKELLPPEVLAKFPINAAAIEAERREIEEGKRKAEERMAQVAAKEEAAQEARAATYRAAASQYAVRQAQEARRLEAAISAARDEEFRREQEAQKQREKETRESRDGLYLARLTTNMASAVVTMKNLTSSSVSFEWRNLRARFRKGEIREPTVIVVTDKKFGYVVDAGETRTFEVGFGSRVIGDGNWLDDVAWGENVWVSYRRPESQQR